MMPTKESLKRFEKKEINRREIQRLLDEWKNEDSEKARIALENLIDDLENKNHTIKCGSYFKI